MIRQIGRKPVFGMITDQKEGKIGGYGEIGYRERAEHAMAMGIDFVNLTLTPQSALQVRQMGALEARRWNGAAMETVLVPVEDLRAVYIYGSSKVTGSVQYRETTDELAQIGTRFVNSPKTIDICDDKVRSQAIFDEIGVPTPITMDYSRANAKTLLLESGFIFIKEVTQSMGEGQATILKDGSNFIVKIDGQKISFTEMGSALHMVEQKLKDTCIVQEGIRMPKVMDRVYDFRVMLQRDGTGSVVMPAVFARVGAQGLDQSNVSKGGKTQDPMVFHPEFDRLSAEFEEMGREIFMGIHRRSPEVGEIGIDFLVSKQGRTLVLEVNAKPGTDESIRDLGDSSKLDPRFTLRDRVDAIGPEVGEAWQGRFTAILRNTIAYARHMVDA